MGIVSGILVYIVLWWMIFFMTLPWGVEPINSQNNGIQAGAPKQHKLALKFAVTTAISAVIFYLFYLYVPSDMMQWGVFQQ